MIEQSSKHILITGKPGTGKTTLIKRLIPILPRAGGFYTEEIRFKGKRVGFKIVTLSGEEGILAQKDLHSPFRIGNYGVNIEDIEKVGVKAINAAITSCEVIVIDEIGKMELCSPCFQETVIKALESGKKVLATIPVSPLPFLEQVKNRPDVVIFCISYNNREEVYQKIKKEFCSN